MANEFTRRGFITVAGSSAAVGVASHRVSHGERTENIVLHIGKELLTWRSLDNSAQEIPAIS